MLTHKLILLRTITVTNCGAGSGTETVDRPTAVEAITRLPCIPATSLKGIWRDDTTATLRDTLHGTPDSSVAVGRPSQAQLGEAFVLMMPAPVSGGGHLWLISALHIARFFDLHPAVSLSPQAHELLSLLEGITAGSELLVFSPAGCTTQAIQGGSKLVSTVPHRMAGVSELFAALRSSLPPGWGLHDGHPVAIAGFSRVALIVHEVLDERTSTALTESRTAKEQSLRRVQLIPEGTVFVSVLTQNSDAVFGLPDRFSLGSDEGLGWGWLQLHSIQQGPS